MEVAPVNMIDLTLHPPPCLPVSLLLMPIVFSIRWFVTSTRAMQAPCTR